MDDSLSAAVVMLKLVLVI